MVVVGPVPAESREFRFQLFDVLGVGAVVAWPRYQQHSVASLQAIVETFASLASGHRRPALNQVEALAQGAVGVAPEAILTLGNGLYQADGQGSPLFRTRSGDTLGQGAGAVLSVWHSLRNCLTREGTDRLDAAGSADLRDRLLDAKVRSEAGLAMVLRGALLSDAAENHPDHVERQASARLLAFLEPVLAWWPSQAAWQASIALGDGNVQMPGPTVTSEHARELLENRVWAHQSHGLQIFLQTLQQDLEAANTPDTRQWALSLSETLQHAVKVTQLLGREIQAGSPQRAMANARRYLNLFGEILGGWMWLQQANVAATLTDTSPEVQAFRAGKLQAARYFFHRVLPGVAQDLVLLQNQDSTSLDMRAAWY